MVPSTTASRPGVPRLPLPRPGATERDLLIHYRRHGDASAREALVERFLPLARQLARRYQRGNEPLDDLVQVASVGLVKAIDRFDPDRGTAFSSYAVPTILGELKRHFRDTGWALHVPRGVQERVMRTSAALSRLAKQLGRSPTTAELAEATGLSREEVVEALEAATAYDALSLDAPRSAAEGDGDSHLDGVSAGDPGFGLVELRATLAPALRTLPERDRLVLHLRIAEDMTQSEIAELVGVSQMHVSRLIRRALARLQDAAAA